ncbi:MAG: hypothetical protein AAGD07_23200 [Planctomycetota bacterium]
MTSRIRRRQALAATTTAVAAPLFIPSQVLGMNGAVPPSERVNVGLIGLGSRCRRIATDTLENVPHIQNFADCVKSRGKANADIEFGHRSSTICYLLNIARAVGKVGYELRWDPESERFTNCDEGNAMLERERRTGWELPT